MATQNNTIKTRIQLKSDTEANWNKAGPKDNSHGFVPLAGELIIYSADNAHHFSRLKVGDGETNVVNLPFIDAGTLNGTEPGVVKLNTFNDFPSPGSQDKLYIDLSTCKIYHYTNNTGYTQLSNFEYNITKAGVTHIVSWSAGTVTRATINENTLFINNGVLPDLVYEQISVVKDITKEGTT